MLPELYNRMKSAHKNEMVPYVQYTDRGEIKAIIGFEEHAYYSTGYSALFNSFGFMTETLVYKPYPERVVGTMVVYHRTCALHLTEPQGDPQAAG